MLRFIGGLAGLLVAGYMSHGEVLKAKSLDIYRDRAFLTEELSVDKNEITVRLPSGAEIPSLNLSVEPETCYISQIQPAPPEKGVKDRIDRYRQQIDFLRNQIKAFKWEVSLLDRFDINGKDNPLGLLQDYSRYYLKKLQEIKTTEELLNQTIKEFEQFEKKHGKNYRLTLQCIEPVKAKIRFIFTPPVKSQQSYTISGDSVNGRVFIINRLLVRQDTGKDLKGITLKYHTYRKTTGIEPPPPFPKPLKGKRVMAPVGVAKAVVSYGETTSRAFFQVKGIDLPDGEEVVITVSRENYPANFSVFIDGYATVTPFLKATFKTDRFYPPSTNGTYYVDGVFLGKGKVPPIEEGKENRLFFGEDIFIDVSKYQIKDFTEEGFFGKKKTEKRWRYTIKNRHKKEMKITLVDRIPVSHSDKTEIEPFSTLKWKKIDERGLVTWEFLLLPEQELEFEFGYRVIKK